MDTLLQDVRFGLRRLVNAPAFTAMALLTLALGIGANSAIFTVVNGVLFRPLPYAEPNRLVRVFQTWNGNLDSMSPPNALDLRDRTRTLADVAMFSGGSYTLTGRGDPQRLEAARVTGTFFELLGVRPLFGRTFRAADNTPGRHRVVMLSHALWRDRFGRNPAAIGQAITLSGESFIVAGVMPETFAYPNDVQIWVPLEITERFRTTNRGAWYLTTIGRLAPGQSIDTADREVRTIASQLEREYYESNARVGMAVRAMQAHTVEPVRNALLVLLGAVGFVLLIACANVANLFLARAVHREGEMAIRAALGGSRRRLIRQLLTESLLLAIGGGALGLLIAVWGTDVLIQLKPEGIPRLDDVRVDGVVVTFTTVLTIATGVIFGCLPAWQSTRVDLVGTLKDTARGTIGGTGLVRLRGALIVCEMALAVLLLSGAGLLIRSFVRLQHVDAGFNIDRALTFQLSLPDRDDDTLERNLAFTNRLIDRLRAVSGVRDVAAISSRPMAGKAFNIDFWLDNRPKPKPGEIPSMEIRVVTTDYFRTLGIPLRRGRTFTEADIRGAQRVVLLSESAVRRYFPNEDPIGRGIAIGWVNGRNEPRVGGQVVGIVGDVKEQGLREPNEPELYVAFAQVPIDQMTYVVRTGAPSRAGTSSTSTSSASSASASAMDPLSIVGTVRAQVRAIDPNLAISEVQTLDAIVDESMSQSRFYMLLLGTFAAVALVLAAIGIFGVMSNAVAHRTREIGIRLALGAEGREVRRLVLRDALGLAALGIAIGLAAAWQLTSVLATLLFDLQPTDPATFAGVSAMLLAVAIAASYLPAWRASRVDPLVALRSE